MVVSEVVETVRVSVFPAGAGDSVVTPSSSMVRASPAGTLVAVIVQPSTVWEFDPHVPTFPVASLTTPLTIVNVLKLALGKVTVSWLCALADIAPVPDALNVIT